MAVNTDRLNDFLGRFVNDLGATVHAGMVVIGEKLGLYKALASGPMTCTELAAKTDTDERYLRECPSFSQAAPEHNAWTNAGSSRMLPSLAPAAPARGAASARRGSKR